MAEGCQYDAQPSSDLQKSPTKSERSSNWDTVSFDRVPSWLIELPGFLTRQHRPQLESIKQCIRSIFRFHTETLNIWTHLIGTVMGMILLIHFLIYYRHSYNIYLVLMGLSIIVCFMSSMMFHIFCCHSETMCEVFNRADYIGIVFLITGSIIPWIHILFEKEPRIKYTYLIALFVLVTKYSLFLLLDNSTSQSLRIFRTVMFVLLGTFIIFPISHYTIKHKLTIEQFFNKFIWIHVTGTCYILGAFIYASRIPERFYPGTFNIWGQSHTIFHIFVMVGALLHALHTYKELKMISGK